MGIYDRDYYRDPPRQPSALAGLRMWSIAKWLIAINIAVYVLDFLLAPRLGYLPLMSWGHFSTQLAVFDFQVWRFITFQFLHWNLMHIGFNMIVLYFFGPMIESYLGSRRFLAFYLICGVAGAVFYLILWGSGLLINEPWIPMAGASAGIFGILFAAARVAPETRVLLYFAIPVRLRTLAWVLFAFAVVVIITGGPNVGGEAAHLGGAITGLLLIRKPGLLNVFEFRRRRRWDQYR